MLHSDIMTLQITSHIFIELDNSIIHFIKLIILSNSCRKSHASNINLTRLIFLLL